ncbi:hypothetical protein BH09SUM1_BH09SUM1_24350 [soil metagenome]
MPRYSILEINDAEAKVLQAVQNRKMPLQLEAAFTISLSDLEKDDAGLVARGLRLRDRMRQEKMTPGVAALVVPKQSSIVRTVQLPSGDAIELAGMAQFEAEKFIPFNAERHIISNGILRQDPVNGSQVLITAVDSPVMDAALTIATHAGFEPIFAEVSSISLTRAFSASAEGKATEQHGAVILLNIGTHISDIAILRDGALGAARSQSLSLEKLIEELPPDTGSEEYTDKLQAWVGRLARFVRQTAEFAWREDQIPAATAAYVCGEGSQVVGLASALAIALGIAVHAFDPVVSVPMAPGVTMSAGTRAAAANASGALLRLVEEDQNPKLRGGRINLLPIHVIEEQAASERRMLLVISAAMVFIAAILIYLALDMQKEHRDRLTSLYKKYNREMSSVVEDLDLKKKKLAIVDNIKTDRASALVVLDQVSAFPLIGSTLVKGKLTIRDFKYDTTDDVQISGDAMDIEDISNFADYLSKMSYNGGPIFRQVGIPANKPSEALGNRGRIWEFSITCALSHMKSASEEVSSNAD